MATAEKWRSKVAKSGTRGNPKPLKTDVFIAGSGPIGCTFAQEILNHAQDANVLMVEVGSQDSAIIGQHHKNSIKYQKDIDAFVNVIKGALQPVSVPPAPTYMPALGAEAWSPGPGQRLVSAFHNPNQTPELNLPGCAITRTVGGMATHWTCACPKPHAQEREACPLPSDEFDSLLQEAEKLLGVNKDQYDLSVRHSLVKYVLQESFDPNRTGIVDNLPLAVKRNKNPAYVTWSGSNTILGGYAEGKHARFDLRPEHKLLGFIREGTTQTTNLRAGSGAIRLALVKDIGNDVYYAIEAKAFVVACGAIGTPQILWNSGFGLDEAKTNETRELPALGHYLAEQSIAFCQVVLKRELVEDIEDNENLDDNHRNRCIAHHAKFPQDPIHIPFADPEPQVTIPYTTDTPWHTQIHRDAFSYGDVGPKADPRLIVDLRWFGRQEINRDNYVTFSSTNTDIYSMPQATFNVTRSKNDARTDHEMMASMCNVAQKLGAYLPGSAPQFMAPGLALHITGTTRLGKSEEDSVANQYSQVHNHKNLYVGGNGVIPDSTACNPTLTSVAYALRAAREIIKDLNKGQEP
ncbi:unnamed protein product [Rhizoctonia solani]|uniref:Pyranose 2-oxidase n=1 Tax=Rhizoctonia solani TaxID=456999 RepID=A0A8H3EC22_9AGAM|nr:unnamed protein product [Rhizoctonia solani]